MSMPVIPPTVVNERMRLLKIFTPEKAIRIMNAVSKALNGFLRLHNAKKKNKPERNKAGITIIYLRLLSAKMKKIPIDKKEAIIYKTVLATSTDVSALDKRLVRCCTRC